MKKLITAALSLLFAVCMSYTAFAGSLDSPGAPSAGSGMYTLQNLYDYLTNGTALTMQSSFQEPTSGPGSTMKTTKEIGDAVATPFAMCATTTAANVESGKPFFCTQPGSWGVQTGTLVVPPTPTPTITPTITPTSTPIWDEVSCESAPYYGYWSPRSDGGNGCWIEGARGTSCTLVCQAVGLTCVTANWSVGDIACATCEYLHSKSSCTMEANRPDNPGWNGSGCYGNLNAVQDCDSVIATGNWRQCVCQRQP
ncbi:MAG: hypothetical protein NTZ78_03725 [Candidatus Aureabacteria bacterium]|nr:hypothetical protein [Candidatus Auribacterota bacterium]